MKYRLSAFAFLWLSCFTALSRAAEPSLVIDSGGSTRIVKQLIFTAGGTHLVSVGDDRVIRVWDLKTSTVVRTIRDQVSVCLDCEIGAMALSPDNTYLAVGGKFPGVDPDTRFGIYIYNFETGKRITVLKGHQAKISALAFSPTGTQLASGSFVRDGERQTDLAGPVRIWKIGPQGWERSRALREHGDQVASVAFSADETQLVSAGHDPKLVLWNLNSGTGSAPQVLRRHSDIVYGAVFSSDGRFIVSAGGDRKVYLWDRKGEPAGEFPEQLRAVTTIEASFSKAQPHVLLGFDNGESRIVSLPDGKVVGTLKRGEDKVYAAAYSSAGDGTVATSGGFNGEIWVWRAENSNAAQLLVGKGQAIWKVGFAEDGRSIAFGTEHTRDEPNKYGPLKQIIRLQSSLLAGILYPGKRYRISLAVGVAPGSKYYSELEKTTGEGNAIYELKTRFGETVPRKGGGVDPIRLNELLIFKDNQKFKEIPRSFNQGRTHRAYTFTRDGRYIISAGENGYMALYETKNPTQPLHLFRGHTGDISSVAVSPDGRFIVSGSSDQTIKLWHINSDQYLVSFFVASDSEWIAWIPEGYYTSSLRGDRYIGWQVQESDQEQPVFYAAQQFAKVFNRPEVVAKYLEVPAIEKAVLEPPFIATSQQTGSTAVFTGQVLMDSLPPKVQIVSPADAATVSQRIMPLKVLVTSGNLPITEVTVFLNGFVTGNYQGGDSKRLEIETSVSLKPDKNTLVIIASNKHAKSDPETRTIFYTPSPVPVGPIRPIPVSYRVNTPAEFPAVRRVVTHSKSMVPYETQTFQILLPVPTSSPLTTENDFLPMEIQVDTVAPNTQLRILVNGAQRDKFPVVTGARVKYRAPLDRGDNVVTVVTTTNDVDSPPQERRVNSTPGGKPKLIFLGIGISGYSSLTPPLEFGDKDAKDVKALLDKLKDGSAFDVQTRVLSNGEATRPRILEEIKWLNGEAKNADDVRIILISGHGGVYPKKVGHYYFFAKDQIVDADPEDQELSINFQIVLARLFASDVNYGQGHLVIFVDTCRAGSANPKVSADFSDVGGYAFFGSSDKEQQSIERDGNGIFTKVLLQGLAGAADTDGNKMIDNIELGRWLQVEVPKLNATQTPQYEGPASGLTYFTIIPKPE